MQNVRIVTCLPAPSYLEDYEPFIKKGGGSHPLAYGLHTLHRPSRRQQDCLRDQIALCHRRKLTGGYIAADFQARALFLSLGESSLFDPERPLALFGFARFCLTMDVPLFLLVSGLAPFACQLSTENQFLEAVMRYQTRKKEHQSMDSPEAQLAFRLGWIHERCEERGLSLDETVLISNQPQDFTHFSRFSYGVNFAFDAAPQLDLAAYVSHPDCLFLALLLFGRDVTHTRGLTPS